jgi:hypothetical protein
MIPTLCRSVILLGIHSNGSDRHPAVITRVWGNGDTAAGPVLVNLTIFPDNAPPTTRGSVQLYDTEALARAAQAGNPHAPVAYWPGANVAPVPAPAPVPVRLPPEADRQQAA